MDQMDELFGTLSPTAIDKLGQMRRLTQQINQSIASAGGGSVDWSGSFLDLLDDIEDLDVDNLLVRHGPRVPPEDAARTGMMIRLDNKHNAVEIKLAAALDHMSQREPVWIGGADGSIADFLGDAASMIKTLGSEAIILQFLGLDRTHWQLPDAVAKVETNIVKTTAIQLVSAGLNAAGIPSVVVSNSFAAWLVNRSMRAMPREVFAHARNLQIDGFGPLDAMQELTIVKSENYGKITNVRSALAIAIVAPKFGLSASDLDKLPLDLTVGDDGNPAIRQSVLI